MPLIIIGLGLALAFRAGAFNIGAEGQFYAGAIAATWLGLHAGSLPSPLAVAVVLSAALLAGALWVAVPVLLRLRYGVLEVISTLLLNFVAEALTSLVVQGPLQESQGIYPQSDAIAESARLPLLPGTRLHAGILLALAGAVVLRHLFTRTLWGFQLRAVGLSPRAAEISGRIDSRWMAAAALALSGAIAGLAGGVEVAGVSYALFQNLSPGYGFTAIAVALLGRLHPFGRGARRSSVRRPGGGRGRDAARGRRPGGGGLRGGGGGDPRGAAGRVGAARRDDGAGRDRVEDRRCGRRRS